MEQRLVVGFDLDMTLVDSAAGITATLQTALAEAGIQVSAAQVWALNGVPLEDTIAALAPQLDAGEVAALARRYRELYPTAGVPVTVALPGARGALDAVHAAGGRVLVVSTKIETAVRLVVAQVGLPVDEIAGGLFAQAKGTYLAAAGAQVYVGDHPGDMAAARGAAAVGVGVATGPHSRDELAAAGADVVLADLDGFPDWLTRFVSDSGLVRGSVPSDRRTPPRTLPG